jgi:hypothetical protein
MGRGAASLITLLAKYRKLARNEIDDHASAHQFTAGMVD